MYRGCLNLVSLAALFISLQAAGCTIVGATLSAIEAASKKDYDTLRVWQTDRLSEGDSAFVTGDRIDSITGVYRGMHETLSEKYDSAYTAWRMSDPASIQLPSLHDRVILVRTSPLRGNVKGNLLGFDPGVIWIETDADTDRFGIGDLRELVSSRGTVTTGDTLRNWVDRGRVPFLSSLVLETKSGTLLLPMYEVREIRKSNATRYNIAPLAIGACFDIFLILGLRASLAGMSISGGN